MKKIFLSAVVFALAIIAFSTVAFAAELETNDLSVIKEAIANATEGETVTVNMTGDVVVPDKSSAIVLDKNVTLVFNCNGYTVYTNPGGGSAGTVYGIMLEHGYAKLVVNGSSSVDAMNYVVPSDEKLTLSNGVITDPNDATGVKSPDFVSNGPAIYLRSGTIEFNNVYLRQYNSGEWAIFCSPSGSAELRVTNVSLTNSIIRQPDGSGFGALGTRGGNYGITQSCLQVENSVIYGIKDQYWSASKGSYVRDSRFIGSVKFDGYVTSGSEYGVSFDNPVIFENVIFENPTLEVTSGTAHICLVDCKFPNGMSIGTASDRNGSGTISIINSPTCTEPGKRVYAKTNVSQLTSLDAFPNIDEEYPVNNPALGHNANGDAVTIAYTNGFASAGFYDFNCSRCNTQFTEDVPTAPVIFTALGYSYTEDSITAYGGIAGGFALDNAALDKYEKLTKDKVVFGVAVINPEYAGESFFTDKKLTVNDKAIQVEITSSAYASFSYSITGFSGEYESLDLVICAYAYSSANDLEFIQKQYVEEDTPIFATFAKTDATLYSVSCASVKNASPDYIAPSKDEE